uniref:ABC transporter permease n=1 Tax=Schlesneria paludicola TaxID=360056 RepID=A0A7C4QLZ9_9PLAN
MIRLALRNLLSRPVRSLLAWLGLTVSIAGMVALLAISAGMQSLIDRTFGKVPGLLAMQPDAGIPLLSRLPTRWADEIAALPGVRTVVREWWSRAHRVEGKAAINPPRFLFGVDIPHETRLNYSIYRDSLREGRFLSLEDRERPVAVISRAIAAGHRKQLGDTLRVDGHDLTIIGIYETGSLLLDVAILVDEAVSRKIAPQSREVLSAIYIEPDGSVATDVLVRRIREKFRGRQASAELAANTSPLENLISGVAELALGLARGEPPSSESAGTESAGAEAAALEDGLEIKPAVEWGDKVREFSGDLELFLWMVNVVGVLIALLSILNTMLMSVSERLVDFGILRANGWSRGHVMQLVLAESALLGCAGGVSGCALGWLGANTANWVFPDRAHLYAGPAVLALGWLFSLALGMAGGLYPAWWAVRRSPMEAIRRG